jgi:hypothetical protein
MQTSQGYILCILQHFVTKFCNFTNFNKFFTGIYFFLPKLKISLTCKLPIANQKSVRYSVSMSYFTNIAVQNVNKGFVYITDLHGL